MNFWSCMVLILIISELTILVSSSRKKERKSSGGKSSISRDDSNFILYADSNRRSHSSRDDSNQRPNGSISNLDRRPCSPTTKPIQSKLPKKQSKPQTLSSKVPYASKGDSSRRPEAASKSNSNKKPSNLVTEPTSNKPPMIPTKPKISSSKVPQPKIKDQSDELAQTNMESFRKKRAILESFRKKRAILYDQLEKIKENLEIRLLIDDSMLFESSHLKIMEVNDPCILRGGSFHIRSQNKFMSTESWFTLLSHEIFSTKYGLFKFNSMYAAEIDPESIISQSKFGRWKTYYEFFGRYMAVAIRMKYQFKIPFSRPFLNAMLGKKMKLEDVQYCDKELYQSLLSFKNNEVSKEFGVKFVDEEWFSSKPFERELKKGGGDIDVDNTNKEEYIEKKLLVRYTLSVQKQMNAFVKGFNFVFPMYWLTKFTPEELNALLYVEPIINVKEWKECTKYLWCSPDTKEVVWFWEIVRKINNQERLLVLQHLTGLTHLPQSGFKDVRFTISMNNLRKDEDGYIFIHRCTDTMDLPYYSSREILEQRMGEIMIVINEKGHQQPRSHLRVPGL